MSSQRHLIYPQCTGCSHSELQPPSLRVRYYVILIEVERPGARLRAITQGEDHINPLNVTSYLTRYGIVGPDFIPSRTWPDGGSYM
jgi:hypothetical protein